LSAFAGVVRLDGGAVDERDVASLRDSLAHRGPDGCRSWVEGSCGLVSFSLKTGSSPELPFLRPDAALVVDAESVTEEALSSFAAGGPPDAGMGPFSMASWRRSRGRLLLARDPVGSKPLYYAVHGPRISFSTEAKALLSLPGAGRRPDQVRLREFRAFRFRDEERTFFEGIHRLPAGQCLTADGTGVQKRPFWRPDPSRRLRLPDHASYARAFRETFFEAVRRRLPPSGPVAFSLSGGLDSSAVVSAAARIRDEERPGLRLHAVSFLSRECRDERDYIRAVCDLHHVDLTPLYFEDMDPLEGFEEALRSQESPFYDSLDAYYPALYGAARASGARVILGGDWGDQLLTGPAYLADLLREGNGREFWRELRLLSMKDGGTRPQILKRSLWYLLLPHRLDDRWEWARLLAWRLFLPSRDPAEGPRFPWASQRALYDGAFGVHNQMLLECVDRNAGRHGVEMRFPFLDIRLIEFLLSIPFRERTRDGLGKCVMRDALSDILPPAVHRREDKGDYTEVSCRRLRAAGFEGASVEDLDLRWREKALKTWEDLWIKMERNGTKNPVSPASGT
jgi:asparagine synthase (glutamine-hydrolysing)